MPARTRWNWITTRMAGWGKTCVPTWASCARRAMVSADAENTRLAQADAVVLAVGFDPQSEGESADRTFRLPPGQDELIKQIAAVNKNTVVVVTSGGGVDMTALDRSRSRASRSLVSRHRRAEPPSQTFFSASVNPSGRLPI